MFKILNGMTPVYLRDIFSWNIGSSTYIIILERQDMTRPYG